MRPRAREIGAFFLQAVVLYALLVAPWPGLREAYARAYRAAANAVFGSFGSDGLVRFEPLPAGQKYLDTRITIGKRSTRPPPSSSRHSSGVTGYLPTAEVLALILASPIPWSRKWKALLWGMLLAHALIALRLFIMLLYRFSGDHPCALFAPTPFWMDALRRVFRVTVVWASFSFTAPLAIWVLVTFRRADLERWQRGEGRMKKAE